MLLASVRLSRATSAEVDTELYRYRWTVEAIARRVDGYLCLSGEGDDGAGIVAYRGTLRTSDPTGNAAARLASDEELAAWRAWVAAIEAVHDRLPPTWRDLIALCWWSRNRDGSIRGAAWVAAELDLSLRTLGQRRAIIRYWVAREKGLAA